MTNNSTSEPFVFDNMTSSKFRELLASPIVTTEMPPDFDIDEEALHLESIWASTPRLKSYKCEQFVHAGGSGIVFQVRGSEISEPLALKIARKKLFDIQLDKFSVATNLSPVQESELLALKNIHHKNIVRLHEAIENKHGVIALVTTYVPEPKPLDSYLTNVLSKKPSQMKHPGVHPLSPERLQNACIFLIDRAIEMASAIAYMHERNIYHFDLKPANILIGKNATAVLTDLGSCIDASKIDSQKPFRAHFTWTYAHPELTSLVSDPGNISGGGLKASARVSLKSLLSVYDLFAFGRTLQEALAILVTEFGERCYASYAFRYLHIVASLLLDGRNVPSAESERTAPVPLHGRLFVPDVAMGYPVGLYRAHAIRTAEDLCDKLLRFSNKWSPSTLAPELNQWQPDTINDGNERNTPFTNRVSEVFHHPAMRRLRNELNLGWMREVFPSATNNRWTHSIGVYSRTIDYYRALLSDPEVPTLRILLQSEDIWHALLAAILHDVAQSAFAHDFEAASRDLYIHESLVEKVINETYWSKTTLRKTIETNWPGVNVNRILAILEANRKGKSKFKSLLLPVDGLAADILDGPIDADKVDYLQRDTVSCGVPYGKGADVDRLFRAISTTVIRTGTSIRLALAYKAKGTAAVESLLLARYQMYSAVYWHHAYRCIQAMFVQALAATFGTLPQKGRVTIRNTLVGASDIRDLIYQRIVCGRKRTEIQKMNKKGIPECFFQDSEGPIPSVKQERAFHFVWTYADDGCRQLINRIADRKLFKRIFEIRLGDVQPIPEYSAVRDELAPQLRPKLTKELQRLFLDSVYKEMAIKGPIVSIAEDEAKRFHESLLKESMPLVVLDFPTRGVPGERNFPIEIGDPSRKYLFSPSVKSNSGTLTFETIRQLQVRKATVRIFAFEKLHLLITRYLSHEQVKSCVAEVIHSIPMF